MSVVGHYKLKSMINELFPKEKPVKVGAASVDVCVGNEVITEAGIKFDISAYREDSPWLMEPGAFLLVSMREHTVVPRGYSSLFLLKSTMARMGMSHCFAGWIDPCWDGVLTMELKNYNQERILPLWPGLAVGQLIYMETPISGRYSGRYQHSEGVVPALPEVDYDAGD